MLPYKVMADRHVEQAGIMPKFHRGSSNRKIPAPAWLVLLCALPLLIQSSFAQAVFLTPSDGETEGVIEWAVSSICNPDWDAVEAESLEKPQQFPPQRLAAVTPEIAVQGRIYSHPDENCDSQLLKLHPTRAPPL